MINKSKKCISVSNMNQKINKYIEENIELQDAVIKGEICDIKYHNKGHVYFKLKDTDSIIEAVMFNCGSNLKFHDGDSAIVHGRISTYKAGGRYQIYVDEIVCKK